MSGRRARLVMVGPRVDAQGGIAAVARVLIGSSLAEHYDLVYVGTSGDGGPIARGVDSIAGVIRACAVIAGGAGTIVHLHVASHGSFWRKALVAAWARMLGRPTVVHLHGALFHEFAAGGSTYRRRAVRSLFERANAVVVLSDAWAQRVCEFSQTARTLVIPNPVVVPPAHADASATTVLFAGRLGKRKGVPTLLAAMALVRSSRPEWELVLAGDGDVEQSRTIARNLGIESITSVVGWQGDQQLAQLREDSSIFCLPSHDEGLPVALLEAMASAMCCVVSPVGGIPEHVVDGESGRFVAPGDASALAGVLQEVMADAAERERLGEAARRHVESVCSVDVVVARLEALYGELALSPRAGETA